MATFTGKTATFADGSSALLMKTTEEDGKFPYHYFWLGHAPILCTLFANPNNGGCTNGVLLFRTVELAISQLAFKMQTFTLHYGNGELVEYVNGVSRG